MSNPTQWAVESAAMLAAGEWLKKPSADRTPLLLQDYADHYALKINVPAVMVRSTARELLKTRVGISIEVYPLTVASPGDGG